MQYNNSATLHRMGAYAVKCGVHCSLHETKAKFMLSP